MNLFINLIIWINCVGTTDRKVRVTVIIITERFIYFFLVVLSCPMMDEVLMYSVGRKY